MVIYQYFHEKFALSQGQKRCTKEFLTIVLATIFGLAVIGQNIQKKKWEKSQILEARFSSYGLVDFFAQYNPKNQKREEPIKIFFLPY